MDIELADELTAEIPLLDGLSETAEVLFTVHEGRKIAWRRWGNGPAVVLLHGASGSWRHWVRNIAFFSGERTVLTPDLPGFGDSDEPDYPASMDLMGEGLASGLDRILPHGERYDLVAFSYGGSMASQLLLRHKDRQRSVTLPAAAGLAETRVPPMLSVRGKTGRDLLEAHRVNLANIMIAKPECIDALALRIQHENTVNARLKVRNLQRGPGLKETLDGFKGNVAAIWGEGDTFLYPGALEERKSTLLALQPNATIQTIPQTGHWLAYEAAEIFNEYLRANLER